MITNHTKRVLRNEFLFILILTMIALVIIIAISALSDARSHDDFSNMIVFSTPTLSE